MSTTLQEIFKYVVLTNLLVKGYTDLILVEANAVKPTKKDYFENLSETSQFSRKKMYFLIRNTTLDTKAHMFKYKVLLNILCANKMLFKFGKVTSPRCCFCKLHDETIMHLFYE